MKIYIYPEFGGEDKGDGGVRRVVEAQRAWLPQVGVEVVDGPREADLLAAHITIPEKILRENPDKPMVLHNHGLYWAEYDWGHKWYERANADCIEAIRQADAVTAPSEWVAQAIRRNSLRQVTPISHGVDLDDWPVQDANKGFVLWNKTRVDPVCDPQPLNRLAQMAPDVQFISTFGDETLPNLVVSGTIPYETAKQMVRDCAIYLCTARETFGIGTLEAMAAGTPILGWRWGGQAEFVEHKVTGWLAEPGDYRSLREGLQYCLVNREEMGKAARAVVEARFQWKDVIARYAEVYASVLPITERRPKVSVIVPAYGLEGFLPEALDSVEAQTMRDFECIVVDDASPDRCGQIAEAYAARDTRFRVIRNKQNQYLAGALNTGIAAARGRFVIPLDADNKLTPETLALLSSALENDRSIHIAYGNVEFMEPSGQRWHSGWPVPFHGEQQLTRRDTERPANLVPSSSMFRKDVWELIGGYRRRWKTAEDADFWTRAASYGFRPKMVTEADTLIYRNRDESMSRSQKLLDWTVWYPWTGGTTLPPAAVISGKQPPVPSFDPPQIAVVIPVGPAHRELCIDAMDSVDAQTFRQWECIVVNDSGEPLRWTPSWARVIETSGHLGVAAARNLGIRAARAPLFVPLDADDTLEPEALQRMLEIYQQFKGYVYSDFWEQREGEDPKVFEAHEYDVERFHVTGMFHAVTCLHSVADWESVGGYDETLPAWEDWDLQLKLARAGICGTRAPWPLFTYRKDTGLRREENYAQFEQSKAGILAKWGPFFARKETFMGCGCGNGKVASSITGSSQRQQDIPASVDDFVVVEYIGLNYGARTFRAPSGTPYRFSAAATEQMKLVRRQDAEWFMRLRDFRVREAVPA